MATATTSYTSNTCPRVTLTVTQKSSTGNSVTYSYTLQYVTNGYTMISSSSKTVTASIGGTSVYNAAITVGGKSTYTIKTGTITKSKTHAAQTIALSVSIDWGSATWSGVTLGTRSGSASMTLAAKTSYSIAYSANGGSGAPSKQTKWYGETLTLSTTKPTRTGYTWSKWNTKADGSGSSYASGASYTGNAAMTLYAVWTANTYTITLNKNGGSGGTSSVTKTYNKSATLPTAANSPTRTNYKFLGWATTARAKSAQWKAGATYTNNITANTTLYAVWELAYIAPKITGFKAYRCGEDGTQQSDGEYARVYFNWSVDTSIDSSNQMESITITLNNSQKYSSTAGGTSGTVDTIIPSVDPDTVYTVVASITDTYTSGATVTVTGRVESARFLADFNLETKEGIAFFGSAPDDGFVVYKQVQSHYSDIGFMHEHTSGVRVGVGVGAGGKNHGLYSGTLGKWIAYAVSDTGKMYFNGYEVGINHVLWSGSQYMFESQTATLSSPISSQANGICLIFSLYQDGSALDQEFFSHFVPKGFCDLHNAVGMTFSLCSPWGNAVKYLYISDTSIVGHTINSNASLTVGGITYNNRRFVLRYVVGV